jgi:TRAP-type C4-dicarboxylate transport system permease small subunit
MNHYLLAQVNIGSATKISDSQSVNSYSSFSQLINLVVKNSITIAGIIFVALLIFGGITFIINAGSGDSKKADQSKKTITSSIIGFAIVVFAYLIIKIIQNITGLNILSPDL